MNSLTGVLARFRKEDVALSCDIEQMFHSFYVTPDCRDFPRFLWHENSNLDGPSSEFRMNVHLFGAVSSPAVANFSLQWTAESGRAEFGDEAANFIPRNFYVDDDWSRAVKLSVLLQSYDFISSPATTRKFWRHSPQKTAQRTLKIWTYAMMHCQSKDR